MWKRAPVLVVLTAIVAGALALRLWNIDSGLPLHLLNPDEDTVLGHAMAMGASGNPNPHWFFYPTFFMYLVDGVWAVTGAVWHPVVGSLFSQAGFVGDSEPYFLTARLLVVLIGCGAIVAAFGVGRELGGPWAGCFAAAVVAVETTTVAYSHMAVTDVPMAALFTAALWLALAGLRRSSTRMLATAAVVAGVATSTKYNAGILLLPLAAVAAYAFGRRWRSYLAGIGLFAAGFVLASPFTLLNLPTFLSDFAEQNRINAGGWLGFEGVGNGWLYNLSHNWGHSLGLPILLLAGAGLVVSAIRRSRADVVLIVVAVPYFLYIGAWDANFDRYLVPLVPLAGAFAGLALTSGARALQRASPGKGTRHAGPVLATVVALGALAVPLARSIAFDRGLGRTDTRAAALRALEQWLPAGTSIATDTLAAPLVDLRNAKYFRSSSDPRKGYRLTRLPTPNPAGRAKPRPSVTELRRSGVKYVVTSSAIRDRVMAASGRYPREVAFYRALDARGPELIVHPAPGQKGPTIALYRLT